jgi:hypothetical protein
MSGVALSAKHGNGAPQKLIIVITKTAVWLKVPIIFNVVLVYEKFIVIRKVFIIATRGIT